MSIGKNFAVMVAMMIIKANLKSTTKLMYKKDINLFVFYFKKEKKMLNNPFDKWINETTEYLTSLEKWKESVNTFLTDMTTFVHIVYKITIPFTSTIILWLIFLTIIVLRKEKK